MDTLGPFFGLSCPRDLAILRGFLKLDGDLEPFLAPILDVLLTVLLPCFAPFGSVPHAALASGPFVAGVCALI